MYKIIVTLIVLASSISAESTWTLELTSPKSLSSYKLSSHTVSPDGQTLASLYTSKEALEEGENPKQFLQIGTVTKNWWLGNDPFYVFTKVSFIDNTHLLARYNTSTFTISNFVNLKTRKQTIFFGTAKYITEGENKGLFHIYDNKGYLPAPEYGAYWVDELRNKKGELVEVLSKPKNESGCIHLRTILGQETKYPSLRQKMDDCVYVDR